MFSLQLFSGETPKKYYTFSVSVGYLKPKRENYLLERIQDPYINMYSAYRVNLHLKDNYLYNIGTGIERNYKRFKNYFNLSNTYEIDYSVLHQNTSLEGDIYSGGAAQYKFSGKRSEELYLQFISLNVGLGINKTTINSRRIGFYLKFSNNCAFYAKTIRVEEQYSKVKKINSNGYRIDYIPNLKFLLNYSFKLNSLEISPNLGYSVPLSILNYEQPFSGFSTFKLYTNYYFGLIIKIAKHEKN